MTWRVVVTVLAGLGSAAIAWGQCPPEWLPGKGPPGLDGPAYAMTVYDAGGGPLRIVVGEFFNAGGDSALRIACWDGTHWAPLGGGTNYIVRALTLDQGELIAGGGFTVAGDHVSAYCARWGRPDRGACDTSCDGSINGFDIQAFVGLLNRTVTPCSACAGDINSDGSINGFDIQGFVDCLKAP